MHLFSSRRDAEIAEFFSAHSAPLRAKFFLIVDHDGNGDLDVWVDRCNDTGYFC